MQLRLILVLLICLPLSVFGQSDEELNNILGVGSESKKTNQRKTKRSRSKRRSAPKAQPAPEASIKKLESLAPFSDIAVIQRRFLPKTERFELFPSLGLVVNNSFYWNTILSARLGYNFTEAFAIEGTFAFISSNARKVTDDLEQNLNVEIADIVIPESYYGADIKWSPLYGKLGLSGDSIVPFDMYFSLGGGITQTNQDTSPISFHVGTGQIFALTKSLAFRWDLSYYLYETDTKGGTISGQFSDLYLSTGISLFFPEATYR